MNRIKILVIDGEKNVRYTISEILTSDYEDVFDIVLLV